METLDQRDEDVKQFVRDCWGKTEGEVFFNNLNHRHDKKYIIAIEGTLGFHQWKLKRESRGLFNEIKKEFKKCLNKIRIKRK